VDSGAAHTRVPSQNLIHVKDRFRRSLFAREKARRGLFTEGNMESSEKPRSPLSGPLFIALVGAGYAAVALCYYFMFNHANLQL
jgi:hypothetical protein